MAMKHATSTWVGSVIVAALLVASLPAGGSASVLLVNSSQGLTTEQIQNNLRRAGFGIEPENVNRRHTPTPIEAFQVNVDYATTHSFEFSVFAFAKQSDALAFAKQTQDANRLYQRETRSQIVGSFVFAASTNGSASLPVNDYLKVVRIAERP